MTNEEIFDFIGKYITEKGVSFLMGEDSCSGLKIGEWIVLEYNFDKKTIDVFENTSMGEESRIFTPEDGDKLLIHLKALLCDSAWMFEYLEGLNND